MKYVFVCIALLCLGCRSDKAETNSVPHKEETVATQHKHERELHHYEIFRNPEAQKLNNYGVALLKEGNTAAAKSHFLSALALEPKNATVLNHLGNIEQSSGNFGEALGYFNRSHLVSDSIRLYAGVEFGRNYYLSGEYEKCIVISKYTIANTKDEKTLYLSYYNLTKAHLKLGNCEEAKKGFKETKQILQNFKSFRNRIYALEHELKQCDGK